MISLWNWSWTAALAVGALVWGLIAWCVVAYRRKKDDVGLPEQLRYNVPLEILYTVVPLFMVAVLFFYTARDETALLNVSKTPDVTVNVVGKQWSWDFNYVEAKTYESGTQAELTGKPGVQKTLPTLYLPVNKRTEFVLTARDVIHSFWVPQFLQKLDMIPGKVNRFAGGSHRDRCLPGQVRRAVRRLPLADAVPGRGRDAGAVRRAHGPAAGLRQHRRPRQQPQPGADREAATAVRAQRCSNRE